MSIKLTDGVYPSLSDQAEGMIDSFTSLNEDHIAFGDLNNDGQEEAVVILITRDVGPVGMTSELAVVVNQNGNPFNIATQELGKTEIHSLKISSGIISVDMTPWQSTRRTVNYKLSGSKLLVIGPDPVIGRKCGGGVMGNGGACPTGYTCKITNPGPPSEGTCVYQ